MSSKKRDMKGRFSGEHPDTKYSFGRPRKRQKIFTGYKNKDSTPVVSASAKKLSSVPALENNSDTKNRIIDINILFPELQKTLCCNQCHGSVQLTESSVQGLGFKIDVICTDCKKTVNINSSKKIGSMNQVYEINRRSVVAARALGHGHAGLSTFCALIDTHKPVSQKAFDKSNKLLSKACKKVAEASMKTAVAEEKNATPSTAQGLEISGDGSWRKKGFSSLQGFTSIIGIQTGKVLDVSIKNSYCKACSQWESKKDTIEYEEWFANHQPTCNANHQGSAGKMEVDGIEEIFKRSEKEHQVRYHRYIGDGDSKVFKAVSDSKPYGDNFVIEKRECIAHVQKRMGTRLRNLKKSLAKKPLSDDKTIGGRGRLTAQAIDKMSIYYGKAIRSNSTSVEDMNRAIWASYYHVQSTDANPQHHFCPPGPNSWCAWQKFQSTGRTEPFKHKKSLPAAVMDEIRPIYEDLSNEELLKRCLGGFTQNPNESFNSTVWKLVPKTSFSGLHVLKIGVLAAVTMFNDGHIGLLRILIRFGVEPGHAAIEWAKKTDKRRIADAQKRAQESTKEARSARRSGRQQQEDAYYAPGAH